MTPRSLRVWAAVRWGLLVLMTALAAVTMWRFWGPGTVEHHHEQAALYYCAMHPQIRSPRPGECPICHMTLELMPADRRGGAPGPVTPAADRATPPHPPEVTAVELSRERQRLAGVLTHEVTRAPLGGRLRVPGVVTAPQTGLAQVRVRAAGFVERVAVRQTGVRVARGQVLAWIYSPEIYRAQEELLAATRWSAGGGAAPAGAAQLAAAARRGLELLGMDAQELDEVVRTGVPLRAIPLRAPSAGYVTRFGAVLGSRADPETLLYELADLSTVWILASVPERELSALRQGQTARFWPSQLAAPADAVAARIDLVEPSLDETTRTARVRMVVANPQGRLRPGQFGDVELEVPGVSALAVPRDAVIRTGEHEYVYVAVGQERFEPRSVRTGAARDGLVPILDGVAEHERVVTRGSFVLDSESRLQASLSAAPGAAPPPPAHAHDPQPAGTP